MGRLIHEDNGKLLRYWNFTNSITKSFSNNKYSYINQNFSRYSYNLLKVYSSNDSINRTSLMTGDNMNATRCYIPYNLKLHEKDGYWGNGTMYQTSNYLVKEENVIPTNLSLSSTSGFVSVYIPNKLIGALLNTYIYFFVTLDNSILGYKLRFPVGADFPVNPEIYPYDNMATDYILSYSFSPNNDRNKNLYISTNIPTKKDCYANVFIFIPNRNSVACSIKYNGTGNSYIVNANFSPTQVYEYIDGPGNPPDLRMTGTGYSLYVDGEPWRHGDETHGGEAEITFKSIS